MDFAKILPAVELFSEAFKDTVKQYGLSADDIAEIESLYTPNPQLPLDRFKNKYGKWIATQLLNSEGGYNMEFMRTALDKWERFRLGDIAGVTPDNMLARIVDYENENERRRERHTKKDVMKQIKTTTDDENVEVIESNEYYTLRWIKTYAGSVKYGVQNVWCISNPSHRNFYDDYTRDGNRYWFVNFESEEKTREFYDKISGIPPLPVDPAERLLVMIRAVSKRYPDTEDAELYKKASDEKLLERIRAWYTSQRLEAVANLNSIVHKYEYLYSQIMDFDPHYCKKLSIEWLPNAYPHENHPLGYTQVWDYSNKKNNRQAYMIVNHILRNLEQGMAEAKVKEMLSDRITLQK